MPKYPWNIPEISMIYPWPDSPPIHSSYFIKVSTLSQLPPIPPSCPPPPSLLEKLDSLASAHGIFFIFFLNLLLWKPTIFYCNTFFLFFPDLFFLFLDLSRACNKYDTIYFCNNWISRHYVVWSTHRGGWIIDNRQIDNLTCSDIYSVILLSWPHEL